MSSNFRLSWRKMYNANTSREPIKKRLSAAQAVVRGHLIVSLPVVAFIILSYLIGQIIVGFPKAVVWAFAGAVPGYLWWSIMVPRWRKWVKQNDVAEAETLRLAVMTGLIWPKGSFFEKTEIPPPE